MAFSTFIECDDSDCNSRMEVPQPGQLPNGWVFIQYPRSPVLMGGNGHSQQMGQMVSKVFCGWRCANKLTKSFVQEAAKK